MNVANALVSLQEITESMEKTVNVMIDSVKVRMAMSVGAMASVLAADVFARKDGLESCASIPGSAT